MRPQGGPATPCEHAGVSTGARSRRCVRWGESRGRSESLVCTVVIPPVLVPAFQAWLEEHPAVEVRES